MAPIVPSLRYERRLWRDGLIRVAGVDEVGVAPTCGAVVAAEERSFHREAPMMSRLVRAAPAGLTCRTERPTRDGT